MPSARSKAELQQQKNKLASSYSELLQEFSSKDLRHVGNYTLGRFIAKGSFGKVYLAKHNLTNGSKVVLKSSKKDDSNLAREIHHHRQFVHPHIARLYEVIVTESLVWLVLEYCPGDELYHYLLRTGALPVETVQKIFTQLVGAVAYIHSMSCVHRDLKLENVLLDKNENVKLCDFGFTREYEGTTNSLQTFCGTVCYSAPEMLRGEKYAGEKVDVWSLGIILYALLRGELPFDEDDDQATKAKILKDDPVYPDKFPEAAKSLISRLLSKRPLLRPTLAHVLTDPFLSDHAPQQQAILKLNHPAPFTTELEKYTLERMRSVGVDIDQVIENVLSQRCDTLSGWWALLVEKERRKEAKRERRRKEREADMKALRRLSGASSRLDKIAPIPTELDEGKQRPVNSDRSRSGSRGRSHRRSTPQILVTDLPQLPEGSAIESPTMETSQLKFPVEQRSVRTRSTSRPPLPPKERQRRSSNLQLVTTNPDLLGPTNGIVKRRLNPQPNNHFVKHFAALKHWLVESAKRAKSPAKSPPQTASLQNGMAHSKVTTNDTSKKSPASHGHTREVSGTSAGTHSSYGAALTPTSSNVVPEGHPYHSSPHHRSLVLDASRTRHHRSSLSPSPLTPRSSYRQSPGGLRGRKSTSSSVSSVRSLTRPTAHHSKASSTSSNSIDTLHSPGSRSVGRSPHPSIKVLPVTPTTTLFPSNIKLVRHPTPTSDGGPATSTTHHSVSFNEPAPAASQPNSGVMFARRKKSVFKGPMLGGSAFFGSSSSITSHSSASAQVLGSPAIRPREGSGGRSSLGLGHGLGHNLNRRGSGASRKGRRKSQIIEEEEEEEGGEGGDNEEEIEEVDVFEAPEVDVERGERVTSVEVWDEQPDEHSPGFDRGLEMGEKEPAVAH